MRSLTIVSRRAKPRHRRKKTARLTGYLLHETENFVIIVTLKSRNRKIGDMVQIWILNRGQSPLKSIKSGADANVCLDCPLRGFKGKKRICYVDIGRAPSMIWKKYRRGGYPVLPESDYTRVFGGRAVRFGAYGEPVLIPLPMVSAIVPLARKRTGYTHQWRKAEYQVYREFLMASCDSPADYALAHSMGWRTFRGRAVGEALLPNEITCPAADEAGKRTQCDRCGLCDGSRGSADARKSIVILVHGIGAKNFIKLGDIAAARPHKGKRP
jgi:hypothetical protein